VRCAPCFEWARLERNLRRSAAQISTLYFTGGSSSMRALRAAFEAALPDSRVVVGDAFGSVVSGLGIDAARRFA
jgi:hypothetical chaperone protein